ncbi:hypothetical protein GYMLUDRAFT_77546 [Collybiopsis luxurians FD-317 M1]|uniref:Man(5)GlcNAc(2)-PP-dolichol translocation protein RFT1 n=1 Tax=Collybiopsis luxurians FD-317 M1 TaxID=944289 RepID=A0A0D0BUP2_9AGAR|nr:hypothetical protein GYMLUDRAFT_77546 [Collybiopsis luxurians FD-317 M1]
MGLQLFTRLFTFILNQALSRLASPIAYGIAAIQFELMLSTILFLSREGVRGALLRVKPGQDAPMGSKQGSKNRETEKQSGNAAMNVGFVPILIGVPLAIGTSLLYVSTASAETRIQPHFYSAVAVYVLAALMELLSEPMHNMAMSSLQTFIRVRAEGVGITAKTLATFLVLVYDASRSNKDGGDLALLAFAFGQLMYGSSVFLVYVRAFGRAGLLTSIAKNSSGTYFDRDVLSLSMTMTSQSLVKHFLTEGDKFILSWFSPLQDQGGYALAVNYGSLIARIVFQPIEETLRLYFSKTLAEVTSPSNASAPTNHSRHLPALRDAANALLTLLQMQIVGSLFVVIFGSNYITLVLNILLPPQYLKTSAPRVLEAWIWYIPVLAVNGGLEAFIASVAQTKDVNNQSRWMVLFTLVYTSSAVTLYRFNFGDVALVYANIINLSARIFYAWHFSRNFFAAHRASELLNVRNMIPPWTLALGLSISALAIRLNETRLAPTKIVQQEGRIGILRRPVLLHIALGGALAVLCMAWWAWTARRFLSVPARWKKSKRA